MTASYQNSRESYHFIAAQNRNRFCEDQNTSHRSHQKCTQRSRTENVSAYRKKKKKSLISADFLHGVLFAVAVMGLILFLVFGPMSRIFFPGSSVVEANQNLGEVQYKVVEIHQGDSLWSIARENMTPGYSNIYQYMDEIKECNQLGTNDITSGAYLMIPYYEAQPIEYAKAP